MITQAASLLLPLAAILLLAPTRYLLVSFLALSSIQDTPLLRIGSTPLAVGWFFMMLAMLRCGIDIYPPSRTAIERSALPALPLIFLFPYGIFAFAFSLLFFYENFLIMPGSAKFVLVNAQLFRPVPEMINQNVYLFILIVSIVVLSAHMARLPLGQLSRLARSSYYLAAAFASAIVLWHYASDRFGLWFPNAFFHSNEQSTAWNQMLFGISRISGPFSEPSSLAQYFTPVLFFCGTQLVLTMNPLSIILTMCCAFSMIISTSTTGYASMALFTAYFAVLILLTAIFGKARTRVNAIIACLLAAFALAVLIQHVLSNFDYYRDIIQFTLDKRQSSSYIQRSTANSLAVDIFFSTAGVGAGLGTHRASGLFYAIISAFGVVGVLCFALYIIIHLFLAIQIARRVPSEAAMIIALSASGVSGFAGAALSAGEITGFAFYLPFVMISSMGIRLKDERANAGDEDHESDALYYSSRQWTAGHRRLRRPQPATTS